jgi:hypothetical protein
MQRRVNVISPPSAFCQCLAKSRDFCQSSANSITRAANGFANAWQIRVIFAKHWQNEKTRGFRRASSTRHSSLVTRN